MHNFRKRYGIKNKTLSILGISLIVCVIFLANGFSVFSSSLSMTAAATMEAQLDIRVTNVTPTNGVNGATVSWSEFGGSNITSSVNFPNANSMITYHIEVTNIGNVEEGIYAINETYKNVGTNIDSNLEIKSKTINLKEVLCDDFDNDQCKLGAVTTFDITIGYKNNGYDGTNLAHLVQLDLDFRRMFDITYVNFAGNTSGLPNKMIDGDIKTITFDSISGIPTSVIVTGASGSYSSPTLTLSNITIQNLVDTIVVTRIYSVTYAGFTGNTSGLISTISSVGGTITFNATTGIPTNVIVTGASGSYSSPTLTLSNVTGDVTITNAYSVTYVDFTGSTSTLIDIIPSSGGTIVFNSTSGIPTSVVVTGASSSYSSPTLTLSNVTGNVTITAIFNGNVQVIDNGDGTTTMITETVTENQNGSTTTTINSVTTDSQGNVTAISETETTENTNGSSVSTTTNYDPNSNLPISGSTSNTDTSGNTNTQEVTYDANGNTYVSGYNIDTTNNVNGTGETINNSNIDTGMIVFDGSGFEMNLVFKAKLTENAGNNIFGIIQRGTQNNKYSGFVFSVKEAKSNAIAQMILYAGSNSTYYSNTGAIGSILHKSNKYWGIANSNSKVVTQYTIYLKYLPANYGENQTNNPYIYMTVNPITTGSYCNTNPMTSADTQLSYIPTSLPNATFTLGGNGIHSGTNMINFEVISFNVHKI